VNKSKTSEDHIMWRSPNS